jgi:DNA polymerase-3 subunit alpha
MEYVSLHHHSTYSYMDGYGTPEAHVDRAVELGMPALALTEHGNVSSHVRLEKAARKAGIKPIFGCELYTGGVDDASRSKFKWHLTVLAENQEGYLNLLRLVSKGWADGFYYEPTVSGEMLAEYSKGLIVLSGCSGSKIVCDLLGGKGVEEHEADYRAALATAQRFQNLLGDAYYLETQTFPELDRTRHTNAALERISEQTGIPLIATGDVHYPKPTDNDMQVILHAAGRGNKSFEQQAQSWGYDIKLSPPLSDAKVYRRLIETGLSKRAAESAFRNAADLSQRATVVLPKAERLRYPCPPGHDSASLFRRWVKAGWNYRGFRDLPDAERQSYKDRLKYEMSVIEGKDFVDYFLLLSDCVRYAKDAGIPVGPARGSAAASLVCYLLRITEVNPMQFPTMMFERFIDATREDPPDIDLDFADDRRDEVRQYLKRKYGADRVGNIGNFVRYRGKNAVNDVARVYRIPKYDTEVVNALVIDRSSGDSRFDASLEDTVGMFPEAAAIFEKHPKLRQAMRLEGNMRGMSVHAAGLVVGASPLTDVCAVYQKKSGKDGRVLQVLSIDKYDAEYLEILKIDALGLSTMGMIAIVLDLSGLTLEDLYAIPLDDADTINAFRRNDVVGVFQFEGRATRLVNYDVRPDNFLELADVNALSRPGPLFSGVTSSYVDVKHGRKDPEHLHEVVDRFTDFTKGQIVYQEQILSIIKEIGGFPVTKLAGIRKIISKKEGEGRFMQMYEDFVTGAEERYGIDRELAWKIWSKMVTSAQYSFNTAHAISYSMIAYWCMWLKVHYPIEFFTAALIKAKSGAAGATGAKSGSGAHTNNFFRLLKDARKHDIKISPPDLERSDVNWTFQRANETYHGRPELVAGFSQIPGIGEKMAAEIVRARDFREIDPENGWNALLDVKGIGPKKIVGMLDFCEDDDPFGLDKTRKTLAKVRKSVDRGELPVPNRTHASGSLDPQSELRRVVYWGIVRYAEYKDLLEDERAKTGEDLDVIRQRVKAPDKVKSCTLHTYDDGDEDVYLRFNRWNYPKFARQIASIRPGYDVVVAIGRKRKGFGVSLQVEKLFVIDPED